MCKRLLLFYEKFIVSGLLTECTGEGLHNSVKPAQKSTIAKNPHNLTIIKELLTVLIKSSISIDFQDF